jgi:hypothetical protein
LNPRLVDGGLLSCNESTLDELVSDYEIEFLVPRNEFRSALEGGCVICSGIYGLNKNQTLQILDYDGPNVDGPDLVPKFSATKCAEGGPCDLEEITFTIIHHSAIK